MNLVCVNVFELRLCKHGWIDFALDQETQMLHVIRELNLHKWTRIGFP